MTLPTPFYEDGACRIFVGDCRQVLAGFPDNHFDAIVCDPPYELGFMGKSWDGSGIAYDAAMWRNHLRVLKPGGYMLAFGGTRTYHRLACAIEDAGFVLHPMLVWVFGSGFPKATNLSKRIDNHSGQSIGWFGKWLRDWRGKHNVTQKDIAQLFPSKTGELTGCVANWELGYNLPTIAQFNLICLTFNLPFNSIDEIQRECVGQYGGDMGGLAGDRLGAVGGDITVSATDAARQWDGWFYGRQSLKPALEPICMAQKPPEGRMVDNVLKWGTGAINIDAGRVESEGWSRNQESGDMIPHQIYGDRKRLLNQESHPKGRWPANLILDGSQEVMALFPETKSQLRTISETENIHLHSEHIQQLKIRQAGGFTDSGSAARYFQHCPPDEEDHAAARLIYAAKASRRERDEGLDSLPVQAAGGMAGRHDGSFDGHISEGRNTHPTVKPIVLMRYLVRLVTPPNGIIWDGFAGSGSTLLAAKREGFKAVGAELSPEYAEIAKRRLI